MFDLHHDLLSIMYYCYLRNDDIYLKNWIKNFSNNNVKGLFANLYFMNPDEMVDDMGNNPIDVLDMFKKSTTMFNDYINDINYLFSIEGCDYIADTDELEKLYNLGLRNILLVWNNPNKYGSGPRGDYGLTELGKDFLIKAIDLGISIDVSHMNEKTFFDTIELIKAQKSLGKKVKVVASHSNCKDIFNHVRNLSDEQLYALKSVDGILGLVAYTGFVGNNIVNWEEEFLKHINHAVDIMGIDNVGVSSDDMSFSSDLLNLNEENMVFDYSKINDNLRLLLGTKYSSEDVDKIMYQNVYNRFFKEEI